MLAISGYADPITFSLSGTASGAAGAARFTNSPFTIYLSADTANVVQVPIPDLGIHVFSVDGLSSSIDIGGIGTASLLTSTRFFVNQESNAVGISLLGDLGDLLDLRDTGLGALATYDLRTSLGPLSATGAASVFNEFAVSTTLGPVVFDTAADITSFTALAVPEPSSVGLFALALLSFVVWKSAKRKLTVTTSPNTYQARAVNR
jgi:hypothetical protein